MTTQSPDNLLTAVLAFTAIYIISSVNFSILAARLLHKQDLRLTGSKNAGATNLLRAAGVKSAVAVLLADVGRAYGLTFAAIYLLQDTWLPVMVAALLGGNIFPLFHSFKGGKGMAAAAGALLAINPAAFAAGFAIFTIVVAVSRRVSAGSLSMLVTVFTILIAGQSPISTIITSGIILLIVMLTHKKNILRLVNRKEPPIWTSKK
jgi:glycerol-3-phosphate acyltransferase PlsY